MEDHESLRALFKDWPQIHGMALFKSIDGGHQYYCLYCEGLAYENRQYSIYEITELLKLVGKRMQLFTSSLQKELSESQSNLPIILDWQGLERDILILNVNNTEINPRGLPTKNSAYITRHHSMVLQTGYGQKINKLTMIKNQRNLPRYNILHLKTLFHFPGLENKDFYVKDISLGGLQIFCTTEISLKSFNQVHFRLGSAQEFALNIHQVWGEEIQQLPPDYAKILNDKSEKVVYRAGLRLKFYNKDAYYSWLKLVMAIHKTQQKKNI